MASWADPRYSFGTGHGNGPSVQPFLNALSGRAGIVLNGHEHHYERFAVRDQPRQLWSEQRAGQPTPLGHQSPVAKRRITGVPGVLVLNLQPGGVYS